MKSGLVALGILLFMVVTAVEAKEVSEGMCSSYLSMYCTRCHKAERLCAALEKNNDVQWRQVIIEMAEYDDLDQDVQDTAHACLTAMKPGDPIVCGKK